MHSAPLPGTGPFALSNLFSERWLLSPTGSRILLASSVLVLMLTPVFPLGVVRLAGKPSWEQVFWHFIGVFGTVALFTLWFSMWKFWNRIDNSKPASKRAWFLVLLFGMWYGACVYCWFVYLPKRAQLQKARPQ